MSASRRQAVAGGLAIAVLGVGLAKSGPGLAASKGNAMYGLIGKMTAREGQRDALIAILLEGSGSMPGCRSYIVAKDAKDENGIWVTEVWDSREQHAGSLKLPTVQAAINRGRPLIAGFDSYFETQPMGGTGLS